MMKEQKRNICPKCDREYVSMKDYGSFCVYEHNEEGWLLKGKKVDECMADKPGINKIDKPPITFANIFWSILAIVILFLLGIMITDFIDLVFN